MAPPEKFLELMKWYGYIDPELAEAIEVFFGESWRASYEIDISDEQLAYIEELGNEILPRIPPPSDTRPWMEERNEPGPLSALG